MNSDDRTLAAFEDLRRRADAVDPQYSLQRLHAGSRPPRRWVAALAGAAAVIAVIGAVAVSGFLSGPDEDVVTDTSTTAAVAPDSTLGPPDTPDTTNPAVTTTTTPVEVEAPLPTHRVTGVADDDVLNVRHEPGAAGELYAELPPDYAGIRLADNVAVVEDGGEWWQVMLLDPVRLIGLDEPLHGAPITGWVNSAFLEAYDATYSELTPCSGEVGSTPEIAEPAGDPDHVYSLRQYDLGGCVRTVVTFGQNFDEQRPLYDRISTDVRPADVPPLRVEQVNGTTVVVLEGIDYAWATESGTHESSVALVGRWTDGSLAIFSTVPGFTSVQVTDGRLIIDTTPDGTSSPQAGGIHLLGEPVVGPGGTVELWGLARPFEATLGTLLANETAEAPPFVMTNDYTEAWGLFQYRAWGLEPGETWIRLSQDGEGEGRSVEFPFTVPERDESATVTAADLEITDALRSFAGGGSESGPAFTPDVTMGLGVDHRMPAAPDWTIDVDGWNGYAGPFDVLGPLRSERGITVTTVGPQPHCASPPLEVPAELEGLRRLAIRPAGITACLEWYSVELFLDAGGRIAHVMLDLWEP